MSRLVSINPTTGETIEHHAPTAAAEVSAVLDRARDAQGAWARTPVVLRAEALARAARGLHAVAGSGAELAALEMGKPVREGRAEIAKCAWALDHYSANGAALLADEVVPTEAARSYVSFAPLGTVLGVMPWNFPFWQIVRFAAPTLLAGNAVVVKPAPNGCRCALELQRWLIESGLPPGLFATLLVEQEQVADLIADPRVAAVTLTGSPGAGRAVAAAAGASLKPTVLELGGSDPYVVLADADLDLAARACVAARLVNNGQSCIAGKRWIVVDAVHSEFLERCVAEMERRIVGDPLLETTDQGPLARADLRERLANQAAASLAAGARAVFTAPDIPGSGFFYPPTILADVAPGMPAFDEETFGPLAAVVRARDEREALELANNSAYGLGAAVFTADTERGEALARQALVAGTVFVNAQVHSDPRLPFGGVRESGYGRELGLWGVRAFANAKTISIA